MNVIIVDRNRHESLLADHRKDPYTNEIISVGDRIVVCANCKTVYLESSWKIKNRCFINSKICEVSDTLPYLPNEKIITKLSRDKNHNTKKNYRLAIIFAALFVIALILAIYYSAKLQQVKNDRFADIESVWQRHNIVNENGLEGMEIYVQFNVSGMLDKQGTVVARFYDDNKNKLIASNNSELQYKTIDNHLSVAEKFTSPYGTTRYDTFVLFMPNNNFDKIFRTPKQGKVNLKFDVGIVDDREKLIAFSEYHSFYYSW